MSTDCSPAGCARIVSSARSASSARTNTTTRPSLATSSGSKPRNAQAARTSSATGTEDSTICTPTPAASAISLSVAATPPRVGSRIMDTSAPESSSAAMTPLSGWLSVTMSDPNSSPSRTLSTAMPCAAIGPETRILSPGRTCCGPSSKPGRTNPMPAVLMYTPSPLPESTTFVSPVTIDTPAVRAAAPIVSAMTPSSSSGMPSSRISPTESAKGVAPLTARSLTVPLIARSPTFPPGKKRGRTTYESVLNASFIPGDVEDRGIAELLQNPGQFGTAERRDEQRGDQFGRQPPSPAVPHDDRGLVPQRQRTGPVLQVGTLGHALTSSRRNW